jgi:hypothetical protein
VRVYQAEEGQVGLTFAIILDRKDLHQILGHNPLNIDIGQLRINISFCEPVKPVSFDIERGVYFISFGFHEMRCIKDGKSIIITNVIEGVQFKLVIFFEYMFLKKSKLEKL